MQQSASPKHLQIWMRRCGDVCCAISRAANTPRPNLDLPRGFSYWRDAHPSCRLHASHTSAVIGQDINFVLNRNKPNIDRRFLVKSTV